MNHYAYLLLNMVLVASCITMSLVFLFFPLQKVAGLKNYRLSLLFLALAYFILALFTVFEFLPAKSLIISFPIELAVISLTAILFTFSLITLFNSNFANVTYVLKYMTPTLLFILLTFISDYVWGNISLNFLEDFILRYTHPVAILNILFLLFCIAQFIHLFILFHSEAKKYELKLDNYFADTYTLQLRWVRYCFYGGILFSLFVTASMFSSAPILDWIITALEAVFCTVFGLFYIQYPRTYPNIAPILYPSATVDNQEAETGYRTLSWEKLKCSIIADKYYLCPEINIEEMARHLKIGRSTLSCFINREEKMTFHTWVNKLRIDEAKRIFTDNPDYTIAQVSDMVGFSEPSNFSRQFKLITCQSPSTWRQNQLSKSSIKSF
jgi:AraC-like DNA-binding protein